MEKDSAKLRISQIIKSYFRATHIENSDYQGELASSDVNNIVDKIELLHQKVKLPREVGEELDEYKRGFEHDIDVLDFLTDIYQSSELQKTNKWLYNSDGDRSGHANRLIDAFRYGWEVEPEAKWYVQTPKEWWEDENKPEYVDLDSMGISDGLKIKKYASQFTRDELKKYHLDSDIFKLVPVEDEK